jgi:hypothetical protein
MGLRLLISEVTNRPFCVHGPFIASGIPTFDKCGKDPTYKISDLIGSRSDNQIVFLRLTTTHAIPLPGYQLNRVARFFFTQHTKTGENIPNCY